MNKLYVLVVASVIAISGCGGGGGSSPGATIKVLDGVFKDSNVQGLSYTSGGQIGVTDNKGAFKYEEGSQVAFSIGGVDLGSALGKAIVSPIDLVANGNLASDEVINRVRFLMMLDKNNIPSDGIEISQNVQAKSKDWGSVNFASTDLLSEVSTIIVDASVEDAISHTLPNKEDAIAHLRTTLLCSNAGAFTGSYTGSESGNIALMVDPTNGNLSGSSYNTANQVSVEIGSTSPIDYDTDLSFISTEDSGKEFSGRFTSTDALNGDWVNTQTPAEKGSFSGTRLGGASDAIFRYTATFIGSDKGLFTFDVDAANQVKGIAYKISDGSQLDLSGSIESDVNLKATMSDGTEINAVIDTTSNTVVGLWQNLPALTNGSLSGSGCKLN